MKISYIISILFFQYIIIGQVFNGYGQYHLTELGFKLGGGVHQPFRYSKVKTHAGYNADFFCTKYVCGKGWGWWLELGYRGAHLVEKQFDLKPSLMVDTTSGKLKLHTNQLHAGFYFKYRGSNFHRKKEAAWLLGPFLRYHFLSLVTPDSIGQQAGIEKGAIASDDYRKIRRVLYGPHLSRLLRRPWGRDHSWHLQLGAEYIIPMLYENTSRLRVNSLYIFVNWGFTFWNNL